MGSYSISNSLEEEDLNKLFSKWFVQCGTIFRFTSFCSKDLYVTFEYCNFMFFACSLLINYILFSQSDEVCMAVTPSGMPTLLVFLTCALE